MRRSGRTTRQIDEAIQVLFATGKVKWMDHHALESGSHVNVHGFRKLIDRLRHEHRPGKDALIIDEIDFTIVLIRATVTPVSAIYLLSNRMVVTFDSEGNQVPELQGEYSEALYEKLQERSDGGTVWNGFLR